MDLLQDVHDGAIGETEAAQRAPGSMSKPWPARNSAAAWLTRRGEFQAKLFTVPVVGEQRLRDREIVVQAEVLVDHPDAQAMGEGQGE